MAHLTMQSYPWDTPSLWSKRVTYFYCVQKHQILHTKCAKVAPNLMQGSQKHQTRLIKSEVNDFIEENQMRLTDRC